MSICILDILDIILDKQINDNEMKLQILND
jgi:hypothetical protein